MHWQIQKGIKKICEKVPLQGSEVSRLSFSNSECLNIIFDSILLMEIQKLMIIH